MTRRYKTAIQDSPGRTGEVQLTDAGSRRPVYCTTTTMMIDRKENRPGKCFPPSSSCRQASVFIGNEAETIDQSSFDAYQDVYTHSQIVSLTHESLLSLGPRRGKRNRIHTCLTRTKMSVESSTAQHTNVSSHSLANVLLLVKRAQLNMKK